jgi:hypothetical protein
LPQTARDEIGGNEGGMPEITDQYGARWSVRRRRWFGMSFWRNDLLNDIGSGILGWVTSALLIGAWWPFWFASHWLGVRWRIVVKRDGEKVSEERVRGWRNSRRRIHEILESATAGTPASPPVTGLA